MRGFSIGRLARIARVGVDTIRFYEKRGLLPVPERRPSGFRVYTDDAARQLEFIGRARALGFSLDEISDLLNLQNGEQSSKAGETVAITLTQIERKLVELGRWRAALQALKGSPYGDAENATRLLDLLFEDEGPTRDREYVRESEPTRKSP